MKRLVFAVGLLLIIGIGMGRTLLVEVTLYENGTGSFSYPEFFQDVDVRPGIDQASEWRLAVMQGEEERYSEYIFPFFYVKNLEELGPMPYSKEVRFKIEDDDTGVVLWNGAEVVARVDFSKVFCNNNDICEKDERVSYCANDCEAGVKNGYCDGLSDGKCDPDCLAGEDGDCSEGGGNKDGGERDMTGVGIGVILIVVAGVLFYVKRRARA